MLIPSFFPIQLVCATFIFSDQSRLGRLLSSFSAYAVIRKNHCSNNLFSTIFPHRSHFPSMTCSSAKTVLSAGHQLTLAFPRYASPCLNIWTNNHCVHL